MIFLFIVTLGLIVVGSAIFYGIGPNISSSKALRLVLESIPKGSKKVYDLGSGFGLSAYYLAKKRPDCEVIGIEASLIPYLFSLLFCLKQKNLKTYWKNFYDVSLEKTDVVYCYLYRKAMKKLLKKFEEELHQNSLVISYTFALKKKEDLVFDLGGFYQNKLYVYRF